MHNLIEQANSYFLNIKIKDFASHQDTFSVDIDSG